MSDTGYKLKLKRGLEAVKSFARRSADLRQLSLLGLVETNFASLEISLTQKGQGLLKELSKELESPDYSKLSDAELMELPSTKLYYRARDMTDEIAELRGRVFDKMYEGFYEDWLDYGYVEFGNEVLKTLTEKQLLGQDITEEMQELFLDNFLIYFKENWEAEVEREKRDNI